MSTLQRKIKKNSVDLTAELKDLTRKVSHLGVLEQFLHDEQSTDVVIGPTGVYSDRGRGMEHSGIVLAPEKITVYAMEWAHLCGVRLDSAHPYADGMIPVPKKYKGIAGLRFHAVLAPPARKGAHISVRIQRWNTGSFAELSRLGAFPPEITEFLCALVDTEKTVAIIGPTGSGKTTLLTACVHRCAEHQRVVLLEDTPEVFCAQGHVVSLCTRDENTEGAGAIDLGMLVRQSLRMRPDRLVVGEVRGSEFKDVLHALNTGHKGSFFTVHANSIRDFLARCCALGELSGLSKKFVEESVCLGVDYVIHCGISRSETGQIYRIIDEIGVVEKDVVDEDTDISISQDTALVKTVWSWDLQKEQVDVSSRWAQACEGLGIDNPYNTLSVSKR